MTVMIISWAHSPSYSSTTSPKNIYSPASLLD